MSEMSAALGGSAPKHTITCKDKTYTVSLVTQWVKVAYEKELFKAARESLAGIKGVVDKDYYERKMDALVEKYADGGFAMESEFGQKTLTKPGGSILLLSILMGTKLPDGSIVPMPQLDVMNVVAEKPEETAAVFKAVIVESFPGVNVEELTKDIAPAGANHPKAQAEESRSLSG